MDIILALEPDTRPGVPEPPPTKLFACKQSGSPWWFNGGGGGKEEIGGDSTDDAIEAAGSTYD